jgi:hypothetical protein
VGTGTVFGAAKKVSNPELDSIPHFSCKFFVFEVRRKNEFDERIAEKELILAIVKLKTHLVQVGPEDASQRPLCHVPKCGTNLPKAKLHNLLK